MKLLKLKKGFTMIELLVVIAVIGILAVALLASLNPLEQIKKGRDTRTRSDASQLDSAIERYNASLGYFPWQSSEGEDLTASGADVPFLQINGGVTATVPACSLASCEIKEILDQLTDTNEVKSSFIDRITADSNADMHLYYNDEDNGASVITCFTPESNTFSREAFDRCKAGAEKWGTDISAIVYTGTGPCPDGTETEYAATGKVFDSTSADEMICLP
ncbi:MAG: prepilin-type N-terminal cleavage/methylation domain-containing protein [bacterium]